MGRLLIIWYAIVLHLTWGSVLLMDIRAGYTTGIRALAQLFGSPIVAGWFLVCVALIAAHGILCKRYSMIKCLPQQFALLVSAGGSVHAIITQQFADGVPRPLAFILCDQFPAILAAVFHTIALLGIQRRTA